jgi:MarR family transcriptional regulator for hemolysin
MPTHRSVVSAATLFEFTNALQPVRRIWVQAVNMALADFGLPASLTSALILAARRGEEGIRQNALAEEVGVNPGAMVRILDQAEAAAPKSSRPCPRAAK